MLKRDVMISHGKMARLLYLVHHESDSVLCHMKAAQGITSENTVLHKLG